jgi:8-oxo-dGTP pyrophosphatase MutT (NUDIX family)
MRPTATAPKYVSMSVVTTRPEENPEKRGAVLVPLTATTPSNVIFVERAQHLRRHPGQIAFPGGISEPIDRGDPVATALREMAEELGVEPRQVRVVGRLPEVEQPSSRFRIAPIVGVLDKHARFRPDGEEIAGVLAVPFASVLEPGAIHKDVDLSAARGRPMYALDFDGRHIWGFTARILKSFVDAWSSPQSSLRTAIERALSLPSEDQIQ